MIGGMRKFVDAVKPNAQVMSVSWDILTLAQLALGLLYRVIGLVTILLPSSTGYLDAQIRPAEKWLVLDRASAIIVFWLL